MDEDEMSVGEKKDIIFTICSALRIWKIITEWWYKLIEQVIM